MSTSKFKKRDSTPVIPTRTSAVKPKKKPPPYVLLGTLDELKAYLEIIKVQHGLFVEKISQVQDRLTKLSLRLSSGKADYFSDGEKYVKELDEDFNKILKSSEPVGGSPSGDIGSHVTKSLIEAQFLFTKTICKRAERQISGVDTGALVFEEKYLSRLGELLSVMCVNLI